MPDAIRQSLQDARTGVLEAHLEALGRNAQEMDSVAQELAELDATPGEVFLVAWYLGYVGCVVDIGRKRDVEAMVEQVAESVRSPLRRRPRRRGRPGR